MRQNLFWAAIYNVVAIPSAAGVLAPIGVLLNPAISALAMSASSITVATNALLLKREERHPRDGVEAADVTQADGGTALLSAPPGKRE